LRDRANHQYPNKNFNVVFPFADFILGTYVKEAKNSEKLEMYELGFLDLEPAQVKTLQDAVAEEKALAAKKKAMAEPVAV